MTAAGTFEAQNAKAQKLAGQAHQFAGKAGNFAKEAAAVSKKTAEVAKELKSITRTLDAGLAQVAKTFAPPELKGIVNASIKAGQALGSLATLRPGAAIFKGLALAKDLAMEARRGIER